MAARALSGFFECITPATALRAFAPFPFVLQFSLEIISSPLTAIPCKAILGAGKDYSSVLCITIGTGLGVSLFKDRKPIRGLDGQHPEGGHIAIPGISAPCYCGLDACWEMSASRLALAEIAKSKSELFLIDGRSDFSKFSEGTWREFGYRIADGLITHLVISRPEVVVICGSIIDQWDSFQSHLIARLKTHRGFGEIKNIQPSTIGDLSGAIGATMLARLKIGKGAHPK
jgi:glucokinase